jgi:hypothetical protein
MEFAQPALEKAIDYVAKHARSVDRLALAQAFSYAEKTDLLDAISAYQNADGGFGNAIEPDFRVPDSSVTATTIAFQYLIQCDASMESVVVQKGLDYLVSHFNPESRSWPPVCPTISEYPRAKWWEFYPPISFKPDEPNWANPNIEVIGIFNRYPDRVDPVFLKALNDQAMAWLQSNESSEPHGLLCAMRYSESLQGAEQQQAKAILSGMVSKVITVHPEDWKHYRPQPVWYARTPDALLAEEFGDHLNQNIDFIISQQTSDGRWLPSWEWGRYPEEWPQAKAEWTGYLTMVNTKMLVDFGRAEVSNCDFRQKMGGSRSLQSKRPN